MPKIVKPLAWNPTMDRLEEVLWKLPPDRVEKFRAGLDDDTLTTDSQDTGRDLPMSETQENVKVSKEDLAVLIRDLVAKHGNNWKTISGNLNDRGITPLKGAAWTKDNVRLFNNRNCGVTASSDPEVAGGTGPASTQPDPPQEETPAPDTGIPFPEVVLTAPVASDLELTEDRRDKEGCPIKAAAWLDDAALEDFHGLLTWWREKKGAPMANVRPRFTGTRKNTGISCSIKIIERARKQAKKEKNATGGSLSMLVELLLWRYLGEPEDLLEH